MQISVLNWFQIDENTFKIYIFALIHKRGVAH